jgi:hypothetical protein
MRKSRFTEAQIIGILKQAEGGAKVDVLVRELLRGLEAGRGERALVDVDPVEHQRVEVEVEVQRVAEALEEDHGVRAAAGCAGCRGAFTQPAEDGADEDAAHRAVQRGVEGQEEAHRASSNALPRQREPAWYLRHSSIGGGQRRRDASGHQIECDNFK